MDVDRTRINAVKAGPGDECFYCQKKGHWAKDCRKKQFDGGNPGPSNNGMTFVQRGKGRGRGRGRGQQRGRGQSRGGFRGRGRGGKYIRALEGEEELPNYEDEPYDDMAVTINTAMTGLNDQIRHPI